MNIKKIIGIICGLIIICLIAFAGYFLVQKSDVKLENNNFQVKVFQGNSDCILVKCDDEYMLIDTGLKDDADTICDFLNEEGITDLKYLVLTHMDRDHIGGAKKIISKFNIDSLVMADYKKESDEYDDLLKAIQKKSLTPILLHGNIDTNLGQSSMKIASAEKNYYEDSNDYSIIVSIIYGEKSFLFAGDAEKQRVEEFLNSDLNKKYDFLKVPHHGIHEKLSDQFIENVSAKYSVITCESEQAVDSKIKKSLKETESKVYYNCNGIITIESDGKNIKVSQ